MKKSIKRGRGRPPISGETADRYQLTIPPRVAKTWKKVGGGSISAGVSRNWSEFRREQLREEIRTRARQIEMFESGKMTLGSGRALGTRSEAREAVRRLRMEIEELSVILRHDEAFERWQRALQTVTVQFWPHGSGQPTVESLEESDAAHEALKAVEAQRDRIMKELLDGKRR